MEKSKKTKRQPGTTAASAELLSQQIEDAEDIRDFKARRAEESYPWESIKRQVAASDKRDLEAIKASRKEPRVAWAKVKRDLGLSAE